MDNIAILKNNIEKYKTKYTVLTLYRIGILNMSIFSKTFIHSYHKLMPEPCFKICAFSCITCTMYYILNELSHQHYFVCKRGNIPSSYRSFPTKWRNRMKLTSVRIVTTATSCNEQHISTKSRLCIFNSRILHLQLSMLFL